MANSQAFTDRIAEAKAAAKFTQIVKRDASNRPVLLDVPGHSGRRYTVIIRRQKGIISTECLHSLQGQAYCKGGLQTICYHGFAAIIAMATEAGKQVVFFEDEKEARKYGNFGGTAVPIKSYSNNKLFWMVVK